ncbi:hypothetical protein Bca4012_036465 [Brassica carinata]
MIGRLRRSRTFETSSAIDIVEEEEMIDYALAINEQTFSLFLIYSIFSFRVCNLSLSRRGRALEAPLFSPRLRSSDLTSPFSDFRFRCRSIRAFMEDSDFNLIL